MHDTVPPKLPMDIPPSISTTSNNNNYTASAGDAHSCNVSAVNEDRIRHSKLYLLADIRCTSFCFKTRCNCSKLSSSQIQETRCGSAVRHRSSALPEGPLGSLPSLSLSTKGSWIHLWGGESPSLSSAL